MKQRATYIFILLIAMAMPSCKKAPLTTGKDVTQVRELDSFNAIVIHNDVNVTLIKSESNKVEITAGENIIDNITTVVDSNSGIMTIKNESTLNWIRSYDRKIYVDIYYKDIFSITYASSGYLKTENQFSSDSTYLRIEDGCGDIDMGISNCNHLFVDYDYGTSFVNIHGQGNNSVTIHKKSYGRVDARDYEANNVVVWNNSIGDCWVCSNHYLKAEIYHLGNVWYRGEPDSISEIYGDDARGRLLKIQ